MFFSILLLSVSLSIDALGIGATYGLRGIKIPLLAKIIVSIQSILITSLSLFCGKWLAQIFSPNTANNIGICILIYMGIWIIWQGLHDEKDKETIQKNDTILNLIVKSLGITIQIIRTPQTCDLDNSSSIDPMEALYLGIALSFDSFGAVMGSGASGLSSPFIPFVIAFCQFVFLSCGTVLGTKMKLFSNIKNSVWVILSGILLIIIGILRMI